MRLCFITLAIFLLFVPAYSATLLQEGFSTSPAFPTGWTIAGAQALAWSVENTSLAGGTAGEARLTWTPTYVGTSRLISPSINTSKVHDMSLTFRHKLDDYTTTNTYTIGVQISVNMSTWTTLWSVTGTSDIAATQVTVNIPYSEGMSASTNLAFFFTGNNSDLDFWYIDDVVLTYNNTLGSGTWASGEYFPVGDVIIPNGRTLTLQAGAVLNMASAKGVYVNGRLLVNGTEDNEVCFYPANSETEYWHGIEFPSTAASNDSSLISFADISRCSASGIRVENFNKLRISDSSVYATNTTLNGGGLYYSNSVCIVERCTITNNVTSGSGGGITIVNCPFVRITDSVISYNSAYYSGAAIYVSGVVDVIIQDCKMTNNQIPSVYSTYGCINSNNSDINMNRCLVANNSCTAIRSLNCEFNILNSDFVNNNMGIYTNDTSLHLENSIVYGNSAAIRNVGNQASLLINHSCIQGGIGSVTDNGIAPINYHNNTSSDPLFVNPTPDVGYTYDAINANWRLQYNSPCIDTGNPASPNDPDGSIIDMGVYPLLRRPVISAVSDVYPDQGHQLDLTWKSSEFDISFYPNAYYSIWRQNGARNVEGIELCSPADIPVSIVEGQDYYWRDGERIWYYMSQVPAMNLADYGLIVPTIQDSSSSGTHSVDLMVAYHNQNGFWTSVPANGYSVDNIPPNFARLLGLTVISDTQLQLNWNGVTEGTWEGNSYPEVNGISYKIYGSPNPDFTPTSENYITTTTNPEAIMNISTDNCKFFRILTSDGE